MNWRRWLVEKIDTAAALLTITALILDQRWNTGTIRTDQVDERMSRFTDHT